MLHHDASFRFCHRCGGALEPRRLRAGEPERLVCQGCGHIVYLDPKVAVGTIIRTDDERLVLVRRAIDPAYGKWVFPGGYVDRGEELVTAARREAREESNLDVRIDGLVNIYSYPGAPLILIVYAASAIGGSLEHDEESLEAALFPVAEIPWNELAFPSTVDALRDFRRGVFHPIRT